MPLLLGWRQILVSLVRFVFGWRHKASLTRLERRCIGGHLFWHLKTNQVDIQSVISLTSLKVLSSLNPPEKKNLPRISSSECEVQRHWSVPAAGQGRSHHVDGSRRRRRQTFAAVRESDVVGGRRRRRRRQTVCVRRWSELHLAGGNGGVELHLSAVHHVEHQADADHDLKRWRAR